MDPHMADYDNKPGTGRGPVPDWVEVIIIGAIVLGCLVGLWMAL